MKNRISWTPLAAVILAVLMAGVTGKTFLKSRQGLSRPAAEGLPVFGRIPDFSLTDQQGSKISRNDLSGKIWIADFIFTRCAGVCPLMTQKMSTLTRQLGGLPDIRFVSFSVDPDHDSSQVLAEYAKRFSADPGKWFFLTGDKRKIYDLSEQHFHLGVGEIPFEEREALDQSVLHSSRFVLVDREGEIRGYYDTEEIGFLEPLERDVKILLRG